MSLFRKNKKQVDKGIKKMDKIVTWLVLWSIIASVYGIKKYEQNKKENESNKTISNISSVKQEWKMSSKDIIKWIIFWVKEDKKVKKPSAIKTVLFFFLKLIMKLWKK